MRPEADVYSYVQDLEKHLQMTLFGGMADPEGAVLLVRGALADGDQARAVALAKQTQRLAAMTPGDPDMAAAADRARGLVKRDPAALQRAAGRYAPGLARAGALEDAGNSWAGRGDQGAAGHHGPLAPAAGGPAPVPACSTSPSTRSTRQVPQPPCRDTPAGRWPGT